MPGAGFQTLLPMEIPRFNCAKYGVVWRRHEGWRRYAWRQFPMLSRGSSVPTMALLCRRDARRWASSVISNGLRRLTCAKCGVFWRRLDDTRHDFWRSFSKRRVQWHLEFHMCEIWRLVSASRKFRRVVGFRFSYFLSTGIPLITCAKNGVLWQLPDAQRRFPASCPVAFPGPFMVNMASFGAVASLGVCFPASCPR